MAVRNFFSMAVAEETGCFAFFNGSVLGTEADFRAYFANNFFYLKIDEMLSYKPYIRVKHFPTKNGLYLLEFEIYNVDSGSYEPLAVDDEDMEFLCYIIDACLVALNKAALEWRNSEDYIPF